MSPDFTTGPGMEIHVPEELGGWMDDIKRQGADIKVSVSKAERDRTKEQNALFHVLVKRLAAQAGTDVDWMKDYVKREAVSMGYPVWVEDNRVRCDAYGRALPKPSSEASVQDLMVLVECCWKVANDNGFDIGRKEM